MSDLISRQAAIDALMAWEEDSVWDEECLKHRGEPFWISPSDVVENLPSAEPEIIRCKDCKHWNELLNICDRTKRLALGVNGFCSMAERKENR